MTTDWNKSRPVYSPRKPSSAPAATLEPSRRPISLDRGCTGPHRKPLRHGSLLTRRWEGGGFEPSVPGAKEPGSFAEGELRGIERGRPTKVDSLRGTDGSNPSPSSGESGPNERIIGRSRPGTLSRRGTDGSNPSPSSRQSVSLPQPLSSVKSLGFPRRCARLA
jgi:hypothetical protein